MFFFQVFFTFCIITFSYLLFQIGKYIDFRTEHVGTLHRTLTYVDKNKHLVYFRSNLRHELIARIKAAWHLTFSLKITYDADRVGSAFEGARIFFPPNDPFTCTTDPPFLSFFSFFLSQLYESFASFLRLLFLFNSRNSATHARIATFLVDAHYDWNSWPAEL